SLGPHAIWEKLAALASGLLAGGDTVLIEPVVAGDAFPRLLRDLGAPVESAGSAIRLAPPRAPLPAADVAIPGDLDASLMLLAGAMAFPGSRVGVRSVVVQPADAGALAALLERGAGLA